MELTGSITEVFDEHLKLIKQTAEALKALVGDQTRLRDEMCQLATRLGDEVGNVHADLGHLNSTLEGMEKRTNVLDQLLLKFTKEDAVIWERAAARMNEIEETVAGFEKRANFFEDRLRDLESRSKADETVLRDLVRGALGDD